MQLFGFCQTSQPDAKIVRSFSSSWPCLDRRHATDGAEPCLYRTVEMDQLKARLNRVESMLSGLTSGATANAVDHAPALQLLQQGDSDYRDAIEPWGEAVIYDEEIDPNDAQSYAPQPQHVIFRKGKTEKYVSDLITFCPASNDGVQATH